MTVKARKKIERFEPPSELDVAKRMVERGVQPQHAVIEAEKFVGFYESKDWHVGKSKMKSWRGAVATWVAGLDQRKMTGKMLLTRAAKADALRRINR